MKHILIIIFSAMIFASCQDFFSQTIEVDPPDYTPSLVFHQTISDQEDTVRLTLSRSYGVLEQVNNQEKWFVKGATVEWWQNGQKTLTLLPLSADSAFVYVGQLSTPPQPGQAYEIRVTHPDFAPVVAKQTMPAPINNLSDIKVKRQSGTNEFGDPVSEVEFSFADQAGEKNFYEFYLTSVYYYLSFLGFDPNGNAIYDTITYPVVHVFETTYDPNIKSGIGGSTLLSDQFFDGQTYKFRGQFVDYQNGDTTQQPLYLTIRSATPDYYYWSKSYYQQSNSGDNPFAEPVSVYNNLENGLGIFGLFSERKFELQ